MPLLRGTPYHFASSHEQHSSSVNNNYSKIYFCDLTNETFFDFEQYQKQMALYSQPIWGCKYCSETVNVPLNSAMECERQHQEQIIGNWCPRYVLRALVNTAHKSSLNPEEIVNEFFSHIRSNYIPYERCVYALENGEQVTVEIINISGRGTAMDKLYEIRFIDDKNDNTSISSPSIKSHSQQQTRLVSAERLFRFEITTQIFSDEDKMQQRFLEFLFNHAGRVLIEDLKSKTSREELLFRREIADYFDLDSDIDSIQKQQQQKQQQQQQQHHHHHQLSSSFPTQSSPSSSSSLSSPPYFPPPPPIQHQHHIYPPYPPSPALPPPPTVPPPPLHTLPAPITPVTPQAVYPKTPLPSSSSLSSSSSSSTHLFTRHPHYQETNHSYFPSSPYSHFNAGNDYNRRHYYSSPFDYHNNQINTENKNGSHHYQHQHIESENKHENHFDHHPFENENKNKIIESRNGYFRHKEEEEEENKERISSSILGKRNHQSSDIKNDDNDDDHNDDDDVPPEKRRRQKSETTEENKSIPIKYPIEDTEITDHYDKSSEESIEDENNLESSTTKATTSTASRGRQYEMHRDDQRPFPCYEGFPVSYQAFGDLLMIWNFVHTFSETLQLSPFSLENLQDALEYSAECNLLTELHKQILILMHTDKCEILEYINHYNRSSSSSSSSSSLYSSSHQNHQNTSNNVENSSHSTNYNINNKRCNDIINSVIRELKTDMDFVQQNIALEDLPRNKSVTKKIKEKQLRRNNATDNNLKTGKSSKHKTRQTSNSSRVRKNATDENQQSNTEFETETENKSETDATETQITQETLDIMNLLRKVHAEWFIERFTFRILLGFLERTGYFETQVFVDESGRALSPEAAEHVKRKWEDNGYSTLSAEQRVDVLSFLFEIICEAPSIKYTVDASINEMSEIRRRKYHDNRERMKEHRQQMEKIHAKRASFLQQLHRDHGEAGVKLPENMERVTASEQHWENMMKEISHNVELSKKEEQKLEELQNIEKDTISHVSKQKKETESSYEKELNKISVRTLPLGLDRYYNRYWFLRGTDRLFVEEITAPQRSSFGVKEEDRVVDKVRWGYYSSGEQLNALMKYLDSRGIRERKLLEQLRKNETALKNSLTSSNYTDDESDQEKQDGAPRRSARLKKKETEKKKHSFLDYVNTLA